MMLTFISIIWLIAISYTVLRRSKELKRATNRLMKTEEKLNQFLYEQEIKEKRKSKKSKEESSDTGDAARSST